MLVRRRQDEWVVCKVFNKKAEAKTATKTEAADDVVEGSNSAVTTPNASSVVDAGDGTGGDFIDSILTPPNASSVLDAGEGTGDDFIDSMFTIDPLYLPNSDEYTSNLQLPAKSTTVTNTTAAPPYNADYYYSVPATAGTFNVMPNYSLTNAPSNMQAPAVATNTMASSVPAISGHSDVGPSWQNMLNTAPHGMGRRSYDVNLHDQQAIMVRALGGVVGSPNFRAPAMGLPSAGVPPQQKKLGSYDDCEFPYGNYDVATMNGQPAATRNFGSRPY